MKNKIFTRIIITTLLCAFLTFNVGKVTRVSAVGTTIAASAAAALCAVGIVYCSYMALSGAAVHVPDTDQIQDWLTDMGSKVVQYPSGRAAYEELYPELIGIGDEPLTSLLDRAWTWTSDKLKSWANDFSSVDVIQNIATFSYTQDLSQTPTNGFTYSIAPVAIPQIIYNNGSYYGTFDSLIANGVTITYPTGPTVYYKNARGQATILQTDLPYMTVRNLLKTNGKYVAQYYDGTWHSFQMQYRVSDRAFDANGNFWRYLFPNIDNMTHYQLRSTDVTLNLPFDVDYPIFPQVVIHDETTDTDLPMVVPDSLVTVRNPQYPTLPPDDDNKPVIPYLKLPFDPSWIDPVTGMPGGGNWGFNLYQLLDALEDLANLLMEIGTIGELINQFKNAHSSDTYYIYYDDSENNTNYYEYYTITNFGDNIYNYDIDVSEADEHLPVDLNTIQTYSSNRYLEQLKQSAINGSSIVRDLAVFWYDVDPEVTYIALGICIMILIGAFIGKLGHS